MKSSGMKWIIPAVIVAITALIVFQINWLVREAEMKKQDEKRRVGEALRLTCLEMEKREARGFIGNSLDSVFVRHPRGSERTIRTNVIGDSGQQIIVTDDIRPAHGWPVPPPPPGPPVFDSSGFIAPPPPPFPPMEVLGPLSDMDSFHVDKRERNAQIIVRQQHMKSAMEDVVMEYVFGAGVPDEIDTVAFDSILDANLTQQGIDYKRSRRIIDDAPLAERMMLDSASADNEWMFRSKVYPGAPDPFAPQVIVEVDPGNASVLMRILPQIIFSVLITAGMLLLFLLIYREALRQKKISDIRRDFINNMTHEFKTPLATMSLAADTIMNEKIIGDKDKVKYYAEQIKAENRKLNQQVEKVLELALTEKTGVVMHKEEVNVTELVLRAMKSMQLQVEAKGGTVVMQNNPQQLLLNADAFHLERVFVNLLDNALKYGGTPPHITVSMEQYRSGTQIRITDNGAGIAQSEWEQIFDPFYRVSTGDVHNVKGFGLGLSYAQSVIKEHNGSISVTQSNHSGTTFTITLLHELIKNQNESR